ncbi:EamA/RhaT family transporter [Psychromonas sp. B3M02]|uniref:DMT family transporter n=1 Tax=Psychromonas sp. B3M02 TaxID=2267226 RepID=UPI000DE8262F|nr:DMT family transporter [Psychromonas sp. B3M02]RBW41722.1 EamA/RhaT family transporter [Psychromonas sp. B3M02]
MSVNSKSINKGILLCFGAYGIFSIQDAVMKWMVADFGVAELLFWRSLAALFVCLVIGRKAVIKETLQSPVIKPLMWRSLVAAFAWVFYYLSGKELSLAQMTTIYYSAPIIVVVLAVLLLNEKPTKLQWTSVFIGFIGVLIASRPGFTSQALSVCYALFSALLWAYTYILLRKLSGKASIFVQMVAANFTFIVITGVSLPWTFTAFDSTAILVMIITGVIGAAGQYFLFASFEHVEATVLAPIEYTGLIWAFIFSYLIWGSEPNNFLIMGAMMIAVSGFVSVLANNKKNKAIKLHAEA